MPPFEYDDLNQTAVVLPPQLVGGIPRTNRMGEIVYDLPYQTAVRWVYVKRESKDSKGNTITIDADVVAAVSIVVGTIMWLGTMEQYIGTGSAGGDAIEFMRVETRNWGVDLKGRIVRYEYELSRFRGKMPIMSM
jgi:hypothetical protein